jgi:hypothetical protein
MIDVDVLRIDEVEHVVVIISFIRDIAGKSVSTFGYRHDTSSTRTELIQSS